MQEELKALEEEADKLLQAQEIQSPAEAAPEDSTEEVRISGFEFFFFHTSSFEDIAVFIAVFFFFVFLLFLVSLYSKYVIAKLCNVQTRPCYIRPYRTYMCVMCLCLLFLRLAVLVG